MATRIAKVAVDLSANSAQFTSELAKADATLKRTASSWQRHLSSMDGKLAAVGSGMAALAGGLTLGAAVNQIYSVNAEFQKLAASLKTVTGSTEGAKAAMATIEAFASETPYKLSEVTAAFIKLKAMGLDASIDSLRAYGNTASALGKPIDQMIEAVADAATGEFERLKEFGIKASSEGDKVRFTFQGVSTTVGKNAAEIERYLKGLGEVQFAGAMAEQMKTLGGLTSNLADQFDALMRAIGDAGANDAMSAALIAATAVMAELAKQTRIAGEGFKDWDTRGVERLQHDADVARERITELRKELELVEKQKGSVLGRTVFSGYLDDKAEGIRSNIRAEENVAAYSAVRIAQMNAQREGEKEPEAKPAGPSEEAAKKAAQHVQAVAKQIAELQFQQAQLTRTSREQAIYNELQKNGLSITSEAGQKVAELAAANYDASERQEQLNDLTKAANDSIQEQSEERTKGTKALDDYIAGLQREVSLIGMSADAREQNEALFEAENIARQHGIELNEQQRQQIIELTATKQGLIAKEDEHKAALQELEGFGERAFDRIGSSMTEMAMQGQSAWQAMGNIGMAVMSELLQEMFKLAAINPLKNLLFGGNAATLQGVGGLIGSLFGGGANPVNTTATTTWVSPPAVTVTPLAATGGLIAGGTVRAYANGGKIHGPGTGTSDDILAAIAGGGMIRVSNGESIVTAEATSKYWPLIDAMNKGRLPAFASGGMVGSSPALSPSNIGGAGGGYGKVVVNNYGDQEVTTKERQNANGGTDLEVMVDKAVAKKLGQRSSSSSKMLRQNFGARERLINRGS